MQALQYSISINASPSEIWRNLWNKNSYTIWSSIFTHGTYAICDFKTGDFFQFLNPEGNGLYGVIDLCTDHHEILFNHKGEIKNFENILDESKIEHWTNITEHYLLSVKNKETILTVTLNGLNDWQVYFDEKFPKALLIVKLLSEKKIICTEIETTIPISKVWKYWTTPQFIMQWNYASPDWHCPKASNDLQIGGAFNYTMAAKDESFLFDFSGKYTAIEAEKNIYYTMDDGRIAILLFIDTKNGTRVIQAFEPEKENTIELQTGGWQAILNNFKQIVETN